MFTPVMFVPVRAVMVTVTLLGLRVVASSGLRSPMMVVWPLMEMAAWMIAGLCGSGMRVRV